MRWRSRVLPRVLNRLEAAMAAAAREQAYERAASLRNQLDALRWLTTRLEHLRELQATHSFVYPVDGADGLRHWYVIHRGFVEAVLPAPTDADSCRTAGKRLQDIFCKPGRTVAPVSAERLDELLLVLRWFREHPQEREKTLPPAEALALCRPRMRDWLRRL